MIGFGHVQCKICLISFWMHLCAEGGHGDEDYRGRYYEYDIQACRVLVALQYNEVTNVVRS